MYPKYTFRLEERTLVIFNKLFLGKFSFFPKTLFLDDEKEEYRGVCCDVMRSEHLVFKSPLHQNISHSFPDTSKRKKQQGVSKEATETCQLATTDFHV